MTKKRNPPDKRPLTDAERALAEQNMPLVYRTVNEYHLPADVIQDYTQIGMIGLCKAAKSYGADRGAFSTWAVLVIRSEIGHALITRRAQRRGGGVRDLSLDDEKTYGEHGTPLVESLYAGDNVEKAVILRDELERVRQNYGMLDERSKLIIRMRMDGYKLREISDRIGLRRSRTKQLLQEAREGLRYGLQE